MMRSWRIGPLKWCLFAQPENVYRGAKVKHRGVLANEDAILPGIIPCVSRSSARTTCGFWTRRVSVFRPKSAAGTQAAEGPFCCPRLRRGSGHHRPRRKYRFMANFRAGGGAATCGKIEFLRGRSGGDAKGGNRNRPLGEMIPSLSVALGPRHQGPALLRRTAVRPRGHAVANRPAQGGVSAWGT